MLNLLRLSLLILMAFKIGAFELKDGPITIGDRVKPHESAILQIESTTQGYLTPRMTTVQRDAIVNPADGLQIFNTDIGRLELYAGGIWSVAGSGGADHPLWETVTAYPEGSIVVDLASFKVYRANFGHTSDATSLQNDIALGYWDELSDDIDRLPTGTVVDNTLPRWDGTTGDILQTSSVTISDTDDVGSVSTLAIGTASPDTSSVLDTTSTTKGSRPCPSMTEVQRNAIVSPADGLCVYNTDTKKLNIYDLGSLQWNSAGGGLARWETAQSYKLYDTIWEEVSEKIYYANTAHTSTVFATDIANWTELSDDLNRLANGTVTDETILRWNGTTGDDIQTSNITISDTDDIGNISSLIIGGTTPVASSVMDVVSTTSGSRPCPSMTRAQRDAIVSPASGLCIYNTDIDKIETYSATYSNWSSLGGFVPGTGIYEGLVISQSSPTTFDISAGSAAFVDYSAPRSPISELYETLVPITGITDAFPSARVTYIGVNVSGTILQQTSDFTATNLRTIARLGAIVKDGGSIILVSNNGIILSSPFNQFNDLAVALGPIVDEVFFRATGANLQLSRTAGSVLTVGGNRTDPTNPNFIDVVAASPTTLIGSYQNGIGGTTIQTGLTVIDPTLYDDGSGTLATVPSNKITVLDLYYSATVDDSVFTYGQNVYNTIAEATGSLLTRTYIKPAALENVPRRGWLIIRESVTDLQAALLSGDARILDADVFGNGVAGAATLSVTTLQKAYENSEEPEITLTATRGALDIFAPTTDPAIPYLTVNSNNGLLSYFGVEKDGVHSTALVLDQYATKAAADATTSTNGRIVKINDNLYRDNTVNYIKLTDNERGSLWGKVNWPSLDADTVTTTGTGSFSESSLTGGEFGESSIRVDLPVIADTVTFEIQAPAAAIDARYNVTKINYLLFDHSSTITMEVLDWNDVVVNSVELQNTGTGAATVTNLRYGTASIDYNLPLVHGSPDRSIKIRFSSDAALGAGSFLVNFIQSDYDPRAIGEWVEVTQDYGQGASFTTTAGVTDVTNITTVGDQLTIVSNGISIPKSGRYKIRSSIYASIVNGTDWEIGYNLDGVTVLGDLRSTDLNASGSRDVLEDYFYVDLIEGQILKHALKFSQARAVSLPRLDLELITTRRSITAEIDSSGIPYTPTFQGFGTVSGVDIRYNITDNGYRIYGEFITGTVTATEAQMSLPNLDLVDGTASTRNLGLYMRTISSSGKGGFILGTNGDSFVNFGAVSTLGGATLDASSPATGSAVAGNTERVTFDFFVPIQGSVTRKSIAITLDEIRADGLEYPVFGEYVWVGTTKYQKYRRSYNISATGTIATLPLTYEIIDPDFIVGTDVFIHFVTGSGSSSNFVQLSYSMATGALVVAESVYTLVGTVKTFEYYDTARPLN